MSDPLVSIVIPAYNAARTLEATVQSALKQTVTDIEVIIVDDGSTDDTLAVGRRIADSRVKVISQRNGGASSARNAGIRAATGKYVALLDADDLWVPHKLERQLEVLETNLGVHAIQSGAYFVDDNLQVLSVQRCTDTGRSFEETLLFKNLPAYLSALMVRRDRLIEVGMFDTELEILEEWDMALKMSRFCGMRSVEEPLVLYRVHAGNRHRNVDIHIKPGLLVLQRLFADPGLPPTIKKLRSRSYGTFYRTLAGGYFNIGKYASFIRWAVTSLITDPAQVVYMAQLPLRRLRRWHSRKRPAQSVRESLKQAQRISNRTSSVAESSYPI
jgi:glycosyltransferase involved in cell wall biosynthesis